YTIENYPMSSLLEVAYGISSYQLAGPGWLDAERFTVNAKLPEGATKGQLGPMMQSLPRERFKLAVHFEKKEISGDRPGVAKGGPKPGAPPGNPKKDEDPSRPPTPLKWTVDKDGYPELPPGRQYSMSIRNDKARWRFADESMEHFAKMVGNQIHQPV